MFNIEVGKFLIWLGISFLGFVITKLSLFQIPLPFIKPGSWITTWMNLEEIDGRMYLQLNHESFNHFHTVYDYLETLRSSLLIYFISDVSNRIHLDDPLQLLLLPVLIWSPIFGSISLIKGMDYSISPSSLKHLSPQAKVSLALLGLLLTGLTGFHCYLAYIENILPYYLAGIITVPLLYYGLYRVYLKYNGGYWHIHHWFIGFYLCLCTRFDNWISNFFFMVFYSVFLQGALAFGVTPIITAPDVMMTTSKDWAELSNDSF